MAGYSTYTFPYNCVVLIESPNPSEDGYYFIGSGVVIGPHTILTASHVVYDTSAQTPDQNITLYPGWTGTDPALGPGYISTGYTDHYYQIGTYGSDNLTKAQSSYDYAIIDTSYTFTSWMGVLTDYQGGTVHMTGYPATAGGDQTDSIGIVSADPSYSVLDYGTLSTSPGNSGGPIWLDYNGSDDVAGIVSTSGYACQLTTADWSQIESWVSQDGYSIGTGGGGSGGSLGAGWNVVGTGDFTGNGTDDVLLQNGGSVVNWIMHNGQFEIGNALTTAAAGWNVVGTGDFTDNGTDDVLLQNDGTVVDWIMHDGQFETGNIIAAATAGWNVVGTGDFTGNGTDDVLLQSGGSVVDWIMQTATMKAEIF
jgi:V8-like Glu-specific endopeptidase